MAGVWTVTKKRRSCHKEKCMDTEPIDDWYYPVEESAEWDGLSLPMLVGVLTEAVLLSPANCAELLRIPIGGEIDGWRVAEALPGLDAVVVLEREFDQQGVIVFRAKAGIEAEVRKAVGRLDKMEGPTRPFPAERGSQLMAAKADVLAEEILADGEDPSYARVASLLPPLHSDWSLDTPPDTYTFIGTPEAPRKYAVAPDGTIGFRYVSHNREPLLEEVLFEPRELVPAMGERVASKRGLLGGYLPAIDYGFYDPKSGFGWELWAFMAPGEPASPLARIRRSDNRTTFYRIDPFEELEDGKVFYSALLRLQQHWGAFFARGMQLEVDEPRVTDATRAAIVRGMTSFAGLHPKYGLGAYWRESAEGFPPPTISLNTCLLDWGFPGEAQDRIGYYFDHFVKPDGTLDFYGTAVSEYGQLLGLAAKCVRQTGDLAWFKVHRPAIERMIGHLLKLREDSKQSQPRDAVSYGLLYGSPEADTRKMTQYYFSGTVWAWRGLLEIGSLYVEQGGRGDESELVERGKHLLAECTELREDIFRAVDRSIVSDGDRSFLPPIAGHDEPFDAMWQDTLSTYTNYRYWLETISAGCLSAEQERMMLDYRLSQGGELLSMTRFEKELLDDWPFWHQARNLLTHDRIDRYLLAYYAHQAHHQTRGTFTAFELVYINGTDSRRIYDDYCVPSQMTVPLMTRWMLALEEQDRDVVWLFKAVPRAWLRRRLSFSNALTRWGPVGVRLEPSEDLTEFTAKIRLGSGEKPKLMLRVRHPAKMRIAQCDADGAQCDGINADRELVCLAPTADAIDVRLTFG